MKRLRLLLICCCLAAVQYCFTENSLPERVWCELQPWLSEEPVCQQPAPVVAPLPAPMAPLPGPADTLPAKPSRDASVWSLPSAVPKFHLPSLSHFLTYFLAQ